jgi:ribosomal protein S18 acetylase RimI-like enzyme
MIIRKAISSDAEQIHTLLCDIARLHAEGNPDVFEAKTAKYNVSDVEKMIDGDENAVIVATEGEKVLGYLICQLHETKADGLFKYRRVLYIDDLCVDGESRASGIGRALFEEAKRVAVGEGCTVIDLNVWAFNKGAIAFYEKMGMTESRRRMELKL